MKDNAGAGDAPNFIKAITDMYNAAIQMTNAPQ